MRITKVTTKTGDKGKTRLGTNEVVSKSSLEIQVLGELDELSSVLGLVKVSCTTKALKTNIESIQNDLFNLGGEVSLGENYCELLTSKRVESLESEIAIINEKLPPLKEFVFPGIDKLSAKIHFARSVCRRVERSIVSLQGNKNNHAFWTIYLNRLSDYLFVLARQISLKKGGTESTWDRTR